MIALPFFTFIIVPDTILFFYGIAINFSNITITFLRSLFTTSIFSCNTIQKVVVTLTLQIICIRI